MKISSRFPQNEIFIKCNVATFEYYFAHLSFEIQITIKEDMTGFIHIVHKSQQIVTL
jgi:hypothetical protein